MPSQWGERRARGLCGQCGTRTPEAGNASCWKCLERARAQSPQKAPESASGHPITTERLYTDEELEFLLAMQKYKKDKRRPFPTWVEVLDVLRTLGWILPEKLSGK